MPTVNASDASCSTIEHPLGLPLQAEGFGRTGDELTHLFNIDLGNQPTRSVLDPLFHSPEQVANLALFSHVQESYYWAGVQSAWFQGYAWLFFAGGGRQGIDNQVAENYALAVRAGDVAAVTVPEPQTLALVAGALALAGLARKGRLPL